MCWRKKLYGALTYRSYRYRLYAGDRDYAPAAYANLLRLKRTSLELFARLRRP